MDHRVHTRRLLRIVLAYTMCCFLCYTTVAFHAVALRCTRKTRSALVAAQHAASSTPDGMAYREVFQLSLREIGANKNPENNLLNWKLFSREA